MTPLKTTLRVDRQLLNEAVKLLGVKSRTEAARAALKAIVARRDRGEVLK
jgi:Arc/MetJ family transcription regulator